MNWFLAADHVFGLVFCAVMIPWSIVAYIQHVRRDGIKTTLQIGGVFLALAAVTTLLSPS